MSKVAKATIGLMVITLISKVLGFGRDLVLSAFYGATMYSDVYLVSLDISRLVFQVIGTAISTTYIPLFFDNIKEGGEEQGNYFTNNVLNITISIGIVISIFAFIFAKPLAKIFASGFNEQALKLTVQFTRIILFGTIFSGLSKIMQSYLQSKGEYYISGMIGFPFNIIIIASIVLSKYFGLYILPIGAVLALASQFFFQIPRSKKRGYKYSLVYNPKDRYIKEMMMLTMPVMIGVGASQINTMVDRTLASQLAVGSISAMKYADRLNTFVLGLFISSITIVIYPMLSKLKSEKQYEKFNEYIKTSINVVILMILPITAIAIVLAEPIVVLLFERGAFDSAATQMTSAALAFYSIGLIGLSLKNVIANVFYSMQDTKTPMYNGVIAVVINIVLNLILVKYMGISGIALATSVSSIVCVVILLLSLRKKINGINFKSMTATFIKSIIATVIMAIAVKTSYHFGVGILSDSKIVSLLMLGISAALGGALYIVIVKVLKIDEIDYVFSSFKKKLLKNR